MAAQLVGVGGRLELTQDVGVGVRTGGSRPDGRDAVAAHVADAVRPREQRVDLLVGDVQAPEPVLGIGVDGAPAIDRGPHAPLDEGRRPNR